MPSLPQHGVCPHCRRAVRVYARGLCSRCYTRPAIRQRYQSLRHKMAGLDSAVSPEVKAIMEARIRLYRKRAAKGLPLFEDAG